MASATETEAILEAMARGIDKLLNGGDLLPSPRYSFALFIAENGKDAATHINYVSNNSREEMQKMLMSVLMRWNEGQVS